MAMNRVLFLILYLNVAIFEIRQCDGFSVLQNSLDLNGFNRRKLKLNLLSEEEDTHDNHGDETEDFELLRRVAEEDWENLEELAYMGSDKGISATDLANIFANISDCRYNSHNSKGMYEISEEDILRRYGVNGTLNDSNQFAFACQTIISCLVSEDCVLKSTIEIEMEENEEGNKYMLTKSICAMIIFIETLVGAIIPAFLTSNRDIKFWLSLVNCFSGGVFLTTGFSHLVAHVTESQSKVTTPGAKDYPLGLVLIVVSFVFVFFIEHILFDVHNHTPIEIIEESIDRDLSDEKDALKKKAIFSLPNNFTPIKHIIVIFAAISVHTILESLVLGLEDTYNGVWLIFASIASHKGVTAMALTARFIKANASRTQTCMFMLVFSLICPVSIFIGVSANQVPEMLNMILMSLSTGTFIYIGAYEVISDEFSSKDTMTIAKQNQGGIEDRLSQHKIRYIKFFALLVGVLLIVLLELVPESHDHGEGHED